MPSFQDLKNLYHRYTTATQRGRLEHEFKIAFIKAHKRLSKYRYLLNAATSNDPWAMLSLMGFKNTTRIYHEADRSRPVEVPVGVQTKETETGLRTVVVTTTAYIVNQVRPGGRGPTRKTHYAPDGPLGPEDWELGLQAEPVSFSDEDVKKLQDYWQSAPDVRGVFFHR